MEEATILVKDLATGGYTGFYKDDPCIIVEGDTVDQTLHNLKAAKEDILAWEEDDWE